MGFFRRRKKPAPPAAGDVVSAAQLARMHDAEFARNKATIAMYDRHFEEMEAFRASPDGQTIERFYALSIQLDNAPASQQEAIARELVAFAPETARACAAEQEFRNRQARESGQDAPTYFWPRRHPGYRRLAINYEREKRFADAITICEQAKHEGWLGDWDKRIERCQVKAAKQQ